jgi:hypothetical protein
MDLDSQATEKDRIDEYGLMKVWTGEWNLDPQFQKNM